MAFDARVGLQVGGGREQVGNDQLLDRLAAQLATMEDVAGQTGPEETGTAGDKNAHGGYRSVVVFGHEAAALADQEVQVGALVGLQHMVDVELPVA